MPAGVVVVGTFGTFGRWFILTRTALFAGILSCLGALFAARMRSVGIAIIGDLSLFVAVLLIARRWIWAGLVGTWTALRRGGAALYAKEGRLVLITAALLQLPINAIAGVQLESKVIGTRRSWTIVVRLVDGATSRIPCRFFKEAPEEIRERIDDLRSGSTP